MPDTLPLPEDDEQITEDRQFAAEYVREHGRLDDAGHGWYASEALLNRQMEGNTQAPAEH